MLPGFRFLFAAIVLSMSVLVFGLGAAALLRAAHEEFASMPARRAPPEQVFAQRNEPPPTLALLRLEPDATEKAADKVAVPAEPAADATPPAEPEKLAALKPEEAPPPEAVKPEMPAVEAAPGSPPAQAEVLASIDEPKLAAIAETPPASEAASTLVEVPSAAASIAATRIATLGGPAVTIDEPAPAKSAATPDGSAVAKRTKERHRVARRARIARQAATQSAADPFAPSAVTRGAR